MSGVAKADVKAQLQSSASFIHETLGKMAALLSEKHPVAKEQAGHLIEVTKLQEINTSLLTQLKQARERIAQLEECNTKLKKQMEISKKDVPLECYAALEAKYREEKEILEAKIVELFAQHHQTQKKFEEDKKEFAEKLQQLTLQRNSAIADQKVAEKKMEKLHAELVAHKNASEGKLKSNNVLSSNATQPLTSFTEFLTEQLHIQLEMLSKAEKLQLTTFEKLPEVMVSQRFVGVLQTFLQEIPISEDAQKLAKCLHTLQGVLEAWKMSLDA
jgi:hypothetical protein